MDAFWSSDPLLVWGLFHRGLGVVLLISFTSLALQIVPAVGEESIIPFGRRLAKLKRDFPTWRRYLYFPTLLWFCQRNWFLRAIPIVGGLAAIAMIYGGPHAVWALLTCYVCYLSLDLAVGLVLPWDTLLLETMVVSLLLPATEPLPSLGAASVPLPAVTWVFRLLFFRVMFGFGKQKFIGSRTKDLAYLKGFLLNQPLLAPGGWHLHKLPTPVLKLLVVYMFLVEIPVPCFVFVPGALSEIAAITTIALMVGIQICGNFGYFGILTMAASIPLFDNVTPTQLDLTGLFAPGQPYLAHAFVAIHTLAALVTFPFNSWLAQGWHLWAFWYQLPRWVQIPLNFIRALHPFRWVHPYGVFPPNTTPGVKITLLCEVTWDHKTWHEIHFKFAPSHPKSAPHFVAPHHPRGEQAIIYDTFGMNYASLLTTIVGAWDPSVYCMRSPSSIFCQSVVRTPPGQMLKESELANRTEPFAAVRVTTVMLESVSLKEHRETGDWWKRTYIGPHVPPEGKDAEFDDYVFGEPELWHFDAIFWRRRSSLRPLMDRAAAGKDEPMELVRLGAAQELSAADVERFWSELVPLLGGNRRETFDTLPQTVEEVRTRFSRQQRRAFYRLLGRFSVMLIVKLEPHYLHKGLKPPVPVRTYFQLWMLVQHIIGCGKDAYLAALASPLSVSDHVPDMTPQTGLYALSVFRFEEMTFDAQKLRLLERYFHPHDEAKKKQLHEELKKQDLSALSPMEQRLANLARAVSGVYNLMPFLREGFIGPGFDHGYPELYPFFKELDDGEVVVGRYTYPEPGRELAPDIKSLPVPSSDPAGEDERGPVGQGA